MGNLRPNNNNKNKKKFDEAPTFNELKGSISRFGSPPAGRYVTAVYIDVICFPGAEQTSVRHIPAESRVGGRWGGGPRRPL